MKQSTLLIIALSFFTSHCEVFSQKEFFKPNLRSTSKVSSSKKLSIRDIKRGEGIFVSAPNYDNIGQILSKIGFKFNSYQNNIEEAKMLFLNCGTSTKIPEAKLRSFVENGGILYASDLTHTTMMKTFPGIFNFSGSGSKGQKQATIVDEDLRNVIGETLSIHFDLGGWAMLSSINKGNVLMESDGKPIMVSIPYGQGTIFYTCFHNHQQASDKEEALLKLLFAKQVQQLAQMSFKDTAQAMGLNLNQMRSRLQR